jgi:site-specific recombinase XerD
MSIKPHPTKGPGHWYIIYYPHGRKGKQVSVPFTGDKGSALLFEADLRRQNRKEVISSFPKLVETIPNFMAWYKLDHQPSGVDRTIRSIALLLPHFGKYLFTSITPTLIDEYKTERLKKVKPTTINKELAALSKLCKWAEEKGYCQQIRVKRFPGKLTRAPLPDVPTRAEVLALINSMDWPKCGLFCCMYFGGLRVSEASYMLAEKVFIDQGVMFIVGKGNKERIVPITERLYPILKRRLEEVDNGGYLWAVNNGKVVKDLRETIKWACKRAGVTRHITPHKLRHAFGVHATESGIGLKSLQQVMGHSTSQITELYSHLAAAALKKEMGKFC